MPIVHFPSTPFASLSVPRLYIKKIDGKKIVFFFKLIRMSNPQKVVLSHTDKFRIMGIPTILNPLLQNSSFKFSCGLGCSGCHGSKPGCKIPPIEKERDAFIQWVHFNNDRVTTAKKNIFALDFIWRMGHMCFRQHAFRIYFMSNTKPALMDTDLRKRRLTKYKDYFCKVPDMLQTYADNLCGITLSKAQAKLICHWIEDVSLVVLPMCVMKKLLMASIALGFFIKRLFPKGDEKVMHMMFHAVFKKSLVRKTNRSRDFRDNDFLNCLFTP